MILLIYIIYFCECPILQRGYILLSLFGMPQMTFMKILWRFVCWFQVVENYLLKFKVNALERDAKCKQISSLGLGVR